MAAALQLLKTSRGARAPATLDAQYRLASLYAQTGKFDEARQLLDDADHVAGSLRDTDPTVGLAAAGARGEYYKDRLMDKEALPELDRARQLQRRVAPDDLDRVFHYDLAFADSLSRAGQLEKSAEILKGLRDARYAGNVRGSIRATAQGQYGNVLAYLGHYEDAERELTGAYAAMRAIYGQDNPMTARVIAALGEVYASSGQWDKALDKVHTAYALYQSLTGPNSQFTVLTLGNLAILEYQHGDAGQARRDLLDAHARLVKLLGADNPMVQGVDVYLASAELDGGNLVQAAKLLGSLDAAKIEQAAPGENWDLRLLGLRAVLQIRQGHRVTGRQQLAVAVDRMKAAKLQEWIVAPFEKVLQQSAGS
jgi:tetratricopeptide (TPR) repeat protein